jgi:hypothetical protein
LTLLIFVPLTLPEIKKSFELIIIATSLASLFYCSQLVFNQTFLNKVSSDIVSFNDRGSIGRYYNLPVFVYPVIFFLFFDKNAFSLKHKTFFLLINGLAILLSQHRNLLLAILVSYFIYIVLTNRFKIQNVIVSAVIVFGMIWGADYIGGNRFSKGFEDLTQASLYIARPNFYELQLNELSTTEFRQLLMLERLEYILKDNTSSLFGVGLITEDSRKTKKLNFNVGVVDEYGDITQVSSSDIVWSVLLLQFGIMGSFVFLLFNLSLLAKFYSKKMDRYMQVGFLYIVCLLITSFYSSTISQPYVTALLMLFAAYHFNLSNSFISRAHGSN